MFHKAIAQSGVITNPWAFDDWTNKETLLGFKLVEKLGQSTSDPKVAYEFLKTIDAKVLIETEQKSLLSEIVNILILFYCNYCTSTIRCRLYVCALKEYFH